MTVLEGDEAREARERAGIVPDDDANGLNLSQTNCSALKSRAPVDSGKGVRIQVWFVHSASFF